jgi:ClpP class serine protease
VGEEDLDSARGARAREGTSEGEGAGVPESERHPEASVSLTPEPPQRSPLFTAQNADRYERQTLIRAYQAAYQCRLIVIAAPIFDEGIALLEELIYDADPAEDLHVLLSSPGGVGEIAVRMARSMQDRCHELTVIVPDQAKSAATILAMGAHCILMGPTSDLGPVDPQFQLGPRDRPRWVSAKDIIAAVEAAEEAVTARPDTYPLHASLLSDVSGLEVQRARSALARTSDLVEEALRSNPDRSDEEVAKLRANLQEPLVNRPQEHGAIFGALAAKNAGLPVTIADPKADQWQKIWRLYAKYFALDVVGAFEGATASQIGPARTYGSS